MKFKPQHYTNIILNNQFICLSNSFTKEYFVCYYKGLTQIASLRRPICCYTILCKIDIFHNPIEFECRIPAKIDQQIIIVLKSEASKK